MTRGRKPGTPKTGGRQLGTPNKTNKATRDAEWKRKFMISNRQLFEQEYKLLTPYERAVVYALMSGGSAVKPSAIPSGKEPPKATDDAKGFSIDPKDFNFNLDSKSFDFKL